MPINTSYRIWKQFNKREFEKARLDLETLEMYKASVQIKKYDAQYFKFIHIHNL